MESNRFAQGSLLTKHCKRDPCTIPALFQCANTRRSKAGVIFYLHNWKIHCKQLKVPKINQTTLSHPKNCTSTWDYCWFSGSKIALRIDNKKSSTSVHTTSQILSPIVPVSFCSFFRPSLFHVLPHDLDGIAWTVVRSDSIGAMSEDSHRDCLRTTSVAQFILHSVSKGMHW